MTAPMGEVAVEGVQPATQADNRPAVVAALMLTIGLAAIDATIVATAVPQIVADLGGFRSSPGSSRSTCSRRR